MISEALGPGVGRMMQRPVILPPLKADNDRCSVKPASRHSCRFRFREDQAFARAPPTTTNLGRAGQQRHTTGPGPEKLSQSIHTTLMPPLGSQVPATDIFIIMKRIISFVFFTGKKLDHLSQFNQFYIKPKVFFPFFVPSTSDRWAISHSCIFPIADHRILLALLEFLTIQ